MHRLRKILAYRLVPAIVLFSVFVVSSALLPTFTEASNTPQPPTSSAQPEPSSEATTPDLSNETEIPSDNKPPVPSAPVTSSPDPAVTPHFEEPECSFVAASGQPIEYEYGNPVPESGPADDDFFADAVFVGDSRTEGFKLYSGLKTANILAAKSISVVNIYSEDVINSGNGDYVSIIDALSRQVYSKVYIMLGINELGYGIDRFIELYSALIDNIREIQPDADIYIQAIIPVSKEKAETNTIYTNDRICHFNEELLRLAAQKELFFIDTYNAFLDEEGFLPEDASFDGVHLYKDYCVRWLEYLKTHTAVSLSNTGLPPSTPDTDIDR